MAIQRDKVIASAEKLVAKGKIEAAIKEYERLLEDNPNDVNTLNRIGDLWVRINRNDEAVKVFTRIADHYSRDGFFLKAIAIYKKINKLDPSKLEIYAKLADLYAKQGLAMEAKSQYQVLADYYLKHGDPANALAIYRKISELDPNSINVHVKLADLYSANSQTADALKEYDRVGRMLLKRGMLDEAVQVFRKALKIDARNIELVESLVTALIEARNFDSAAQIIEAALEANKENPRLFALLGRVHLARGNPDGALAALERGLAADPNEPSVRENLAELYLRQARPGPALDMLVPLVEKAVARGERSGAVDMLNRVLRVDPGHIATLERLVGVYMRLNEETNILASMNSLAEAHIGRGSYEEAARVLERLIQREPQNAQHRNKLSFVRSQTGGVDTLPIRPKVADAAMPAMEVEEPPPSFDLGGDALSLDIGFDAPPALEIVPSEAPYRTTAPTPVQEALAAEGEDDLDFITEHLTEAEVFAKYGLSEKAVEHLRTVIDRAPKNIAAYDRLFRLLLEEGETETARTAALRYIELLREKGDDAGIDAVLNEFTSRGLSLNVPLAGAARSPSSVDAALLQPEEPVPSPVADLAVDEYAGPDDEISFDLEEPELQLAPEAEPEPAPETEPAPPPAGEEITFPDEEITFSEEELDLTQEEPPLEPLAGEAPVDQIPMEELPLEEPSSAVPLFGQSLSGDLIAEEPAAEPAAEPPVFEFEEERLEPVPSEAEPSLAEEPVLGELFPEQPEPAPLVEDQEPLFEEPAAPETDTEESTATEPSFAEADSEVPFAELPEDVEQPFFGIESLGGDLLSEGPAPEEVGEIDFYLSQELFDEARERVDAMLARFPGDPALEARRDRIESATVLPAPERSPQPQPELVAATTAEPPHGLSLDEIEDELLSALPEEDDFVTVPAPPPAAHPAPPSPPPAALHEDNLFADEDDFFDLAAELEAELGGDDEPLTLSEEEQSLEEIFKEFKKGVEQQLDSEDYDTHYNLGIAYKEMGLIDEAIGEFQLASKDPKRSVECASMLGLCFLEKGMPQLAIKWYRKGLEIPEITEEEHVGLLYDLGSAYLEVGDTQNAQKAYVEVYGMNSNYRDIVSRIKQLEGAR